MNLQTFTRSANIRRQSYLNCKWRKFIKNVRLIITKLGSISVTQKHLFPYQKFSLTKMSDHKNVSCMKNGISRPNIVAMLTSILHLKCKKWPRILSLFAISCLYSDGKEMRDYVFVLGIPCINKLIRHILFYESQLLLAISFLCWKLYFQKKIDICFIRIQINH